MREFKAKTGRDSGLKVCARGGMPKITLGITGLPETLGRDYGIEKPYSAPQSLFLSLNLSAVLKKSTPGKFAYTCHFQEIGINATKIEKTGIHFKTDFFAAVAVVDAKAP